MDKFGLIGEPIAHSLSPKLFEAAYSGLYAYELIQTPDFNQSWELFISDYKAINITAPYKGLAFEKADIKSPECLKCEATNLCIKTSEGIKAYNSDYLGVKKLIEGFEKGSAAIIGFGGAGKAAFAAAQDCGFECKVYRHNELSNGLEADLVIYTLPSKVEGTDKIKCHRLLEANYKNPCMSNINGYISGIYWLLYQAITGYEIMTGLTPNIDSMKTIVEKIEKI